MFCGNCGKEIDSTSAFCPHCGSAQGKTAGGSGTHSAGMNVQRKGTYNTACILGAVISMVAMIFVPGALTGFIGIGISIYGMIDTSKKKEKGALLAIAGLFFGFMAVALGEIAWLF